MYKVMIVDDEKYIRKSIKNRIDWESFGITDIREAGNGEEALTLMDEFCPKIVLVDIRMPKMDGLAFIQEAKKKVPVVQTGEFGADMKVELLNDGPVTICMDSKNKE